MVEIDRGSGGGFRLRDSVALVMGSAVAAVHLRMAAREATGAGWILAWLAFMGIGVTAAGPFELLMARIWRIRRASMGDVVWCVLGVPWVLMSPFAMGWGSRGRDVGWMHGVYEIGLTMLVGGASVFVFGLMWMRWIGRIESGGGVVDRVGGWTDRLGFGLGVCWPLQCGFALVVLG
jgi:hypothetical protein